jgi:hypothetical protein
MQRKDSLLIPFLITITALISCNQAGTPQQMLQSVERTDSCTVDAKNSYEVYIPQRINTAEKLPLFLIIDAHGSGKFALKKFKQAARQYPAMVVASNRVKNGFSNYEEAIRTLIDDVRKKYPAGPMLYMSGFSGGARMALGYALKHPLNGLILCGALAGPGEINALRCPLISISGMDDFNFMETAQYLFQEQSMPGNLKIELTNASHSWPDSLLLTSAFGFLCLSAAQANMPSEETSQIEQYNQQQRSRIDALKNKGDFLKAALISRNMSVSRPFNKDKSFAALFNDLKAGSGYKRQLEQLRNSLKFEISVRQPYMAAFTDKDSLWWKNEIKKTDEKLATEKDEYTNAMYRRIKGFWGIACYSFCNKSVKEHNAVTLDKILVIYRMLEPQNPDMFYFSAYSYLWKENSAAALSMLNKAREAGFSDISQLKKNFPPAITSKLKDERFTP